MLKEILTDADSRMSKSAEALRHDLTRLRTGRASTALVEHLRVPYYGQDVPLSQVANVSIPDSRTISIQPWEKTMVAPVEKAILGSDLGLTPNTSGLLIRINLPALTEERRRDLSKHVHAEGENAKVAVRNIRRDANQQVKELLRDKSISEDEERRTEQQVQELTDRWCSSVDDIVAEKEKELMSV